MLKSPNRNSSGYFNSSYRTLMLFGLVVFCVGVIVSLHSAESGVARASAAPRRGSVISTPAVSVGQGRTFSGQIASVTTSCSPGLQSVQFFPNPPQGITVTATPSGGGGSSGGSVTAVVTASCTVNPGTYAIGTVGVSDNCMFSTTATITVTVTPNQLPTLGTYRDVAVTNGQSATVTPSQAPADPDGDIQTVSVSPEDLPGGGGITVDRNLGVVTILTTAGTAAGDYTVTVTVRDLCSAAAITFKLTVNPLLVNTKPVIAATGTVLNVTQGGPAGAGVVANASDGEEDAGALKAAASDAPTGLAVTVSNNAGAINASATAACALSPGTYRVTLTVSDNGKPVLPALTETTSFQVIVTANSAPTIGAYGNQSVTVGGSLNVSPAAAPKDANSNIVGVTVNPTTLPGGGTLSVNQTTGVVTVTTAAATTPGTYNCRIRTVDSCDAEASAGFDLTVNRVLTLPAAPTNLTATPASSVQIDLAWKDNSDNETGFRIERKIGATGTYALLGTVSANVASFRDSGLNSGTEYFYRVQATNSLGPSAFTNEASGIPPQQSSVVVRQFYPVSAGVGARITIIGQGFVPGGTQVFFGGDRRVPAVTVNVVSPTRLEVVIPPSATGTGNVNGFLTLQVNGVPDPVTTRGLASSSDNPSDPAASSPVFVLLGDVNGDGDVSALDLTLARAIFLRQQNGTALQVLAADVFPLNSNGSRGNGAVEAIDLTFLRALLLQQVTF